MLGCRSLSSTASYTSVCFVCWWDGAIDVYKKMGRRKNTWRYKVYGVELENVQQ